MAGAALRLTAWLLACGCLIANGAHGWAGPSERCTTDRCLASRRQSALWPSLLQVDQRRSLAPGGRGGFDLVAGGSDRACRGASPSDNSPAHYALLHPTPNLEACKARCRQTHGCQGVEFSSELERCEVWMRRIGASVPAPGYTCLRYTSPTRFEFSPADGATDRVCRGAHPNDNSNEYWRLQMDVPSLEACKEECVGTPGCQGVEYRSKGGRCEVWLRPLGISVTKEKTGYSCWRYGPHTTTAPPSTSVTTTEVAPPVTKEGCTCVPYWVMDDYPDAPCENYCCNPDDAPGGLWCFVDNSTCQGGVNWGYCAGPPPPVRPTEKPGPAVYPGFPLHVFPMEWEHFQLVNRLRAEGFTCPKGNRYLPNSVPLKFDCRLWKAARGHSKDMADRDYFGEEGPGKSDLSPWDRAHAEGVSANVLHIGAACDTAECLFNQLKESDTHCNNLLWHESKMFAVGVAFNVDSTWKYYWTELFSESDAVAVDDSCYPPEGVQN
eukprot:CAMPEP_0179066878 /NCGR_PEP_ID=MMETSP0796-20121207/29201_1 /TAXON_ID=73915 /ORGANISM="Pyrodinium bahamense, Strain pbaha01" /LENGTH=493 /DNA_ID=CAMNT_0020763891 /DNA_START=31 /DNA_END=1512 /DNA_ORIENTATION=+